MLKLVLASQSPRRKELLTKAGYSFIVLPVNLSEIPDENLNIEQQIQKIAKEKAEACLEQNKHLIFKDFLILAADTMVIVDGISYGKPIDEGQAKEYLGLLSNRSHLVKTAIHLVNCKTLEHVENISTTEVFFRKILDEEIESYVKSGEPMDKAGGYGIQGLGGTFISKFEGSFENVVGLCTENFTKLLKHKGWNVD